MAMHRLQHHVILKIQPILAGAGILNKELETSNQTDPELNRELKIKNGIRTQLCSGLNRTKK